MKYVKNRPCQNMLERLVFGGQTNKNHWSMDVDAKNVKNSIYKMTQ